MGEFKKKKKCKILQKFCKISQKYFNLDQCISRSGKPNNKSNTKMEPTHQWERFIEFYFEIGLKYKDIKWQQKRFSHK